MLITKAHFNFAMSRARRSVNEKDLALFEEFAEKQKAGRGEAATNFSSTKEATGRTTSMHRYKTIYTSKAFYYRGPGNANRGFRNRC
jgi:hypothetical protein